MARGRKKTSSVGVDVEQSLGKEDLNEALTEQPVEASEPETPASVRRKKDAQAREDQKKNNVQVEEWYECKGSKVVKCVRKKNGNAYRTFLLNRDKNKQDYDTLVAKLKAEGQSIKML